jgi:hypothetical protein
LGGKKKDFPTANGGKIELAGITLIARASHVTAPAEGASLNFNERARREMRKVGSIAFGALALGVALLEISLPRWYVTKFSNQWEIRKMSLP